MKDLNIKKIPEITKNYLHNLLRHAKFIFIIFVLAISGFLVFEINSLVNKEPTQEQINEQLEVIKRPRIDQDTIDKIEQLEDQNVAVQSLFQAARDNPFQD